MNGSGAVFHRLFLNDAQNLQGARFGIAHMARAATAWAGDRCPFRQRGAQALAAHLQQTKLADRAKLDAGTVLAQGIAQAAFHLAAVARLIHVDKVNHNQPAQVAQAHLARHFVGGFKVGAGGGFFNIAAFDGARRVHVD